MRDKGYEFIVGLDEAGRGSWAGPLVAAAIILPKNSNIKGVKDSKLLSVKKRGELSQKIRKQALDVGIGEVSPSEIDNLGLSKAGQLAFKRAIENLKKKPDFILVDAFLLSKEIKISSRSIIKGDTICYSIASASIVAKVFRDEIMINYSKKYPEYGFEKHKGYGTKTHQRNLKKHGITDIHRKSYKPIKKLMV